MRVLLAIIALWCSGDAIAHWDGQNTQDGHYYKIADNLGQVGLFHRSPDDTVVEWAASWNRCPQPPATWDNGLSKWIGHWRGGTCLIPDFTTQFFAPGNEKHCTLGDNWDDDTQSCVQITENCGVFNGELVDYTADANPHDFINVYDEDAELTCLWIRTGWNVNGTDPACFDVFYEATGWRSADEDDFTFAPPDGTTIPDYPDTCPGFDDPVWPGAAGGGPGGTPSEELCPVGEESFGGWAYDGGAGSTADLICLARGCQADVTGLAVCLVGAGRCGAPVTLNGNFCDGTEDYFEGDDSGATGTDMSGVEGLLQQIYSRIGTASGLEVASTVAGAVAVVAAIQSLEGAIEGGVGECLGESCTGDVPTLETVDDLETTTAGFWGRLEGAPIITAITGLGGSMPAPVCPTPTSDAIAYWDNVTFTMDQHCELFDGISPVLEGVMLAFWVLTGGLIILRA